MVAQIADGDLRGTMGADQAFLLRLADERADAGATIGERRHNQASIGARCTDREDSTPDLGTWELLRLRLGVSQLLSRVCVPMDREHRNFCPSRRTLCLSGRVRF
jgi:hypothetical protein